MTSRATHLWGLTIGGAIAMALATGSAALEVTDAWGQSPAASAPTGAAYLTIENAEGAEDRLLAASSDAAQRVELHLSEMSDDGVMRMIEQEDGILIPANGTLTMQPGGLHVMLMGLTAPLVDGEEITLTLEFANAPAREVRVLIDLERMAEFRAGMRHGDTDHGDMSHGDMDHDGMSQDDMDHSDHGDMGSDN